MWKILDTILLLVSWGMVLMLTWTNDFNLTQNLIFWIGMLIIVEGRLNGNKTED